MACRHFQCGGWGSSDRCSYRPNETTNVSSEVYDRHCRNDDGYRTCPWANGGSTSRLSKTGECPYCYFNPNSGWSGSIVCKARDREVDRDTYHKYCEFRDTYGRCPNKR